ncbi:hypothetical protein [Candidatus Ichthyocystis hellenicum]|uniref:hypothetical protein n=1 Tax=Candidatus Ichthyocystis hellenicum TaxID=1561003 RepID=UPI000B8274EB|nr:hypothetical protein [Candidatus Ichthyocystis hellenicum]
MLREKGSFFLVTKTSWRQSTSKVFVFLLSGVQETSLLTSESIRDISVMINSDVSLRRNFRSPSVSSDSTMLVSLSSSSSRAVLQEVVPLPPPYEAEVPPLPPYSEEEVEFSPPVTRLSLDSACLSTIGNGLIKVGLEATAGRDRSRYLLVFTYPITNHRLLFSSRCVGFSYFFKYFALMSVFILLGIIFDASFSGNEGSFVGIVTRAAINSFFFSLAIFLLAIVAGYCWKVRVVDRGE